MMSSFTAPLKKKFAALIYVVSRNTRYVKLMIIAETTINRVLTLTFLISSIDIV